jgi:membrane-bound lytic murein transglycosylase B
MKMNRAVGVVALVIACMVSASEMHAQEQVPAKREPMGGVSELVAEISAKSGLEGEVVVGYLNQAVYVPWILEVMDRPGEDLPWTQYRDRLLTKDRISKGRQFLTQNNPMLSSAEKKYGVPKEVIAAIIGVETNYGANVGKVRLIDSLTTLSLYYPRRSAFFRAELGSLFLYSNENRIEPTALMGSYAGAFGWGQFMPSSAIKLGVDFDGDGRVDLVSNPNDAIGSIGNYLHNAGWQSGLQLFARTRSSRESNLTMKGDGEDEKYIVGKNFRAILRYNRSRNYAMIVAQLAESLKDPQVQKRVAY